MRTLGIVITDGVGFRNFVLSDFFSEAGNRFDRIVIFSCLPESVYGDLDKKYKIIELNVFEENTYNWFFRKIKEVSHLQHFAKDFFGINDSLNMTKKRTYSSRGIATQMIVGWTRFFNSEKWTSRYNYWQQKSFAGNPITKEYKQLLARENINHLFFTHQRPPFIAPLIYAAQKLNIQTSSFIFSWDNLASKGRMAGDFDKYLVWSDLMKSELLCFYTHVKASDVIVVGTPQFEPYILERYYDGSEHFHKKFDLDPLKPTICYSCADSATSKNDTLYIDVIAKSMMENKLAKEVNFLVRTSPAEEPHRFAQLAVDYPFIKWNYPKWIQSREGHQEAWSQRIPAVEDVRDLRSILNYCSLSINMCSTMSLDFMLFDKPVINPVFGNETNGLYNDQRFLKYAHYKKVVESGAVAVAKNENELIGMINDALQFPEARLDAQKALIAMQISKPLRETSKRIAETIEEWSKSR